MAGNIKGITIEIDGKATKLERALRDVTKEAKATQNSLKDINKALNLDPKNRTVYLTQKQRALAKQVELTKAKIKTLKQAQDQLKFDNTDKGKQQYDNLTREILRCENQVKSMEKELKYVGSTAEVFANKFQTIGDKAKGVSRAFAPISAAAGAVGTSIIKMSLDSEDALAKVGTLLQGSGMKASDFKKELIALSNDSGKSFGDLSQALYQTLSSGVKAADAMKFLTDATSLAKAGFTDTSSSVDLLTSVLNSYGLQASESAKISDILINTQNLGKTTVDELANSMGRVLPLAAASNFSMEQLGASYAVLTANGLNTAEATTRLNAMLKELNKTGTSVDSILREKTGHSFKELQLEGVSLTDVLKVLNEAAKEQGKSLNDLFSSTEAGSSALSLFANEGRNFDSALRSMNDSTGTVSSALSELDTPLDRVKKSFNKLKNAGIEMGDKLAPAVEKVIDKVSQLVDWFSSLDSDTQGLLGTLILVIAAISPLAGIIGAISSAIALLIPIMAGLGLSMGWITVIVLGIMALIAIIAILIIKFKDIKQWCQNVSQAVTDFFVAMGEKIGEIWENIKEWFSSLGETFQSFAESLGEVWENVKNVISEKWQAIVETVTGFIETFIAFVVEGFNNVVETIIGIWDSIKSFTLDAWENIKNAVSSKVSEMGEALSGILTGIGSFVSEKFNAIKSTIGNVWNNVKSFTGEKWNAIKSGVSNTWQAMSSGASEKFSGIKSSISSRWDSIKSKTSSVVSAMQSKASSGFSAMLSNTRSSFSSMQQAASAKMDALKNKVQSAISRIKSLFNVRLRFPHIPMPHLSVTGKFSLIPPSVPRFHISWHKKGGIFNKPTLFNTPNGLHGVGEAGKEAIIPIDKLKDYMREVMAERKDSAGEININVENMTVRKHGDIEEIARELMKLIKREKRLSI